MNELLKYLDNVPADQVLTLADGVVAHNLDELCALIESTGPEVFYMHVNDVNNDLATWTRNVVGYNDLADKILNTPIREDFIILLKQIIYDIRNYVPPVVVTPPVVSVQPTVAPAPVVSSPQIAAQIVATTPAPVVSAPQVIVSPVQVQQISPQAIPSQVQVAPQIITPQSIPQPGISSQVVQNPIAQAEVVNMFSEPPVVTTNISAPPVAPVIVNPSTNIALDSVNSSNSVATSTVASSESVIAASTVPFTPVDEKFDFEEIFTMLLSELEHDVLLLDA